MTSPYVPEKTNFSQYLVGYNGLDKIGFNGWLFFPGMLFNATNKWWGDRGQRDRPHEGLDLSLYRDKKGKDRGLDETIKIPVIYEGKVVSIVNDFIGKTLFVSHDIYTSNENILFSIYSHCEPYDGIAKGTMVGEGRVIAALSDLHKKKALMLPHLHISVAWVPQSIPHENLNWGNLSGTTMLTFLNPLEFITHNYTVLEHE